MPKTGEGRPLSAGPGAHVVIAEFEVPPDGLQEFLALARGFAGDCLSQEPGCRQFDVVVLEGAPQCVLFYEAYDDVTAFQAHGRASHLAVFKAAFRSLVVGEPPLRKGRREAV